MSECRYFKIAKNYTSLLDPCSCIFKVVSIDDDSESFQVIKHNGCVGHAPLISMPIKYPKQVDTAKYVGTDNNIWIQLYNIKFDEELTELLK